MPIVDLPRLQPPSGLGGIREAYPIRQRIRRLICRRIFDEFVSEFVERRRDERSPLTKAIEVNKASPAAAVCFWVRVL